MTGCAATLTIIVTFADIYLAASIQTWLDTDLLSSDNYMNIYVLLRSFQAWLDFCIIYEYQLTGFGQLVGGVGGQGR